MKTALIFLLSSFALGQAWAGTFSGYVQTNTVNGPDLLLLDSKVGAAYATRTLALSNLFNVPDFALFNMGTAGSMYGNPTHGPASGQQEWEINASDRLQLGAGVNRLFRGAFQCGVANQGLQQGPCTPWYFNGDNYAASATNFLGYSMLVEWYCGYWTSGGGGVGDIAGLRNEAKDTNGNFALTFYSVANEHPLIGQSPGTVMGLELWNNGIVKHGKETADLTTASASTNYGVSWDVARKTVLNVSANINFTNVPNAYARTNQSDTRELYLMNGFGTLAATYPTNWTWFGESTNQGVAPTNIYPVSVVKIEVEQAIGSTTNYFAHATYATNSGFVVDPAASAFFTATGITDGPTKNAVNNLVLQLKAAGLWSRWDAIYPLVGTTATQQKYNLVNTANFPITWTVAGSTFTGSGWTSDGTASFGDTGFNPTTASSPNYSQNSATLVVYCGTASLTGGPNDFIGATTPSGRAALVQHSSTFWGYDGFNTTTGETPSLATVSFVGTAAITRTDSANSAFYGPTGNTGLPSTSAGVPNGNIYVGCRNASGGAANFVAARFELAMIGGAISASEYTTLSTIIGNFETALGR